MSHDVSSAGAAGLEPVESEPAFAARLFGPTIDTARQFTKNLAERGEELGLIGPLELPRLWTRHIANCALLAPLLLPGRVGDIGSGAGLPGLVLAIARPDVDFILLEPMERRVDWLKSQVVELALSNVEVKRARAEEATDLRPFDQVTARAVSALSKLIPICVPLVRSGGELLFLKGAGVAAEREAAVKAIKKARLAEVEILILGEDYGTEATRVFRAKVD
ncbi:MAG: 16S rRNA (guanine(527)-N(7))-methyltransferase RsmG [Terrimesophilobacter sp.]